MATALILEGGAKRGIYTAGFLDILLENNLFVDAVFGVSAGAIHGCTYAAKQIGRSIRYNLKYGNDPRFGSFQNLLKTGNIVDTEFCYHTLPDTLDPFDHNAFESSGIKFFAVCSNVETGQAEYIHCAELRDKIDCIRASASMPFVSQIVELDGKKFLDGGICDSIPLKAAQNLGYKKNIVILTRPLGYRKKNRFNRFLAKLVYHKYPKFAEAIIKRASMYNQELDFVAEAEKSFDTLVFRPSQLIHIKHLEQNLNVVKQMYELGRHDATLHLEQIKKFISSNPHP